MATCSDLEGGSNLERENEVTQTVSDPGTAEITRQRTLRLIEGKYVWKERNI